MKNILAVSALALLVGGCAASTQTAAVETGYQPGALGVAAIERGDWSRAEELLNASTAAKASDPAWLINMGNVYQATGRHDLAIVMWQRALEAPQPHMLQLQDGSVASSADVARLALERYSLASR